jgi:hypothetical protein
MGIGVGIFLLALGAILTFAVDWTLAGLNLHAVGWILMATGARGYLNTGGGTRGGLSTCAGNGGRSTSRLNHARMAPFVAEFADQPDRVASTEPGAAVRNTVRLAARPTRSARSWFMYPPNPAGGYRRLGITGPWAEPHRHTGRPTSRRCLGIVGDRHGHATGASDAAPDRLRTRWLPIETFDEYAACSCAVSTCATRSSPQHTRIGAVALPARA